MHRGVGGRTREAGSGCPQAPGRPCVKHALLAVFAIPAQTRVLLAGRLSVRGRSRRSELLDDPGAERRPVVGPSIRVRDSSTPA
jgi:hypothetical protein